MLRAELLKLRTVGSTWVALIVGAAGLLVTQVLLVTLLPAIANGTAFAGEAGISDGLGPMDTASAAFQYGALNVFGASGAGGSIGIATIAVLALGVLAGTTDFRHGGIVGTALARPRRWSILGGKVAATAVAATVFGVVLSAIVVAVLLVTVWTGGGGLALSAADIASSLLRGIVSVVLLALIGLGIGVLVRGQLAAFITVGAVLVAEPVLQGIVGLVAGGVPFWARLLPVSLAQAGTADPATSAGLPPVVALIVLGGIAAAVVAGAGAALRRRDL